jgi:SHS2 domain-containing protein
LASRGKPRYCGTFGTGGDKSPPVPLFRELQHTGDLGIEVTAPTRSELFRRCARALAVLLVEPSDIRKAEHRRIEISADNDADLMHDLLTELLQMFAADGFIWSEAAVEERGGLLHVSLEGETFDPSRHVSLGEIKGVTYHRLTVEKVCDEWTARVIFDV